VQHAPKLVLIMGVYVVVPSFKKSRVHERIPFQIALPSSVSSDA